MQYNQVFHHSLWRLFLETEFHKGYSEKFRISKNKNTIVTGFPGLDSVFNDKFIPENPWENKNPNILKIIWAPHHTIEGQGSGLDYSSFNNYYDFFIKYLEKNPNIHIAFKPHPLLREKLYLDKKWGTNKTDKYYNKWNSITNGQLEEGNYINLFFHSDAMILDSGSFIAEYLYFDKPIQFTKKDERILERFNSFGQEVFNHLYQAKDEAEVKNFISEVVIKGNDALKVSRNKFLNEVVLPKNGKIASENIYTELINELC
jgi:CDP-glycerol glycerophosphotransferase (TagB/SpsB family)